MRYPFFHKKALVVLLCLILQNYLIAQDGQLRGKVTNGTEDLIAATVMLGQQTMLTNHSGFFNFSAKPGRYRLVITHAGYKKWEQEIKIVAGQLNDIEVVMSGLDNLDEVVVLGSRSQVERSNLRTPVPVDAFSSRQLLQTGQANLISMLNYMAPSITVERPKINEPVTFRGLDPQHLLILVNGTRYHNSAWLNNGIPKTDLGRGSVANDLGSIPFSAIEKIELLRDGAAAQYGSDAIAGVINIRLKENTGKTTIQVHSGRYYAGDGFKTSIGINSGISLNQKGFLHYAGNIRYSGPTTRAGTYIGGVYESYPLGASAADSARIRLRDDSILAARNISRSVFAKNNGDNQISSTGFLANAGYPVSNRTFFFITGSANQRLAVISGSYRYPREPAQVNTVLYPDGFKPEVKVQSWDLFGITGIRGIVQRNWHWQLSSSIGSNSNRRNVFNSNNASQIALGMNAPTSFYLGQLIYRQWVNQFNLSRPLLKFNKSFKSANIALGAEWRWENYLQKPGEEAAWKNYDSNGFRQGGSQPSIGVISDSSTVHSTRKVAATYMELEMETKKNLLINLAGRYEYYSDFGHNVAGKLALRYQLTRGLAFRASAGNGFRAPSMQQRYYEGTQSFRGTVQIQAILSNSNPITRDFGISSLQAERSINLSGGLVARLSGNIQLTLDGYWIQIKDRIVLTGVFRKDADPDVGNLLSNFTDIDVAQFYGNLINTRTYGADLVCSGSWQWRQTRLVLSLAANINRHVIFGTIKTNSKISDVSYYRNTLFGIEERTALEKEKPGEKVILLAAISTRKFELSIRNSFFGHTASNTIVTNPPDTLYEFYSSKILTDLSVSYRPKDWLRITAGLNNAFDIYPDRLKYLRISSGGITLYSPGSSPFGLNGGYYFLGMVFSW